MENGNTLSELARQEVIDRHRFFEAWMTGRHDEDTLEETMKRFAPGFYRIAPDGAVQTREALSSGLAGAEGVLPPAFKIAVDIEDVHLVQPGLALVRYLEHQEGGEKPTTRRSAALFSHGDGLASVQWRFVQETWVENA